MIIMTVRMNLSAAKGSLALQKALVSPSREKASHRSTRETRGDDSRPLHRELTIDVLNDADLSVIMSNNRRWHAQQLEKDPEYFKQLSKPQTPKYPIGCADSRVPANEIMGLAPGEVFVHRNVANLVVNNDFNVHSVLQYAVNVLKVRHILVTGHYDCGGIKASMARQDHGLLENWIRNIRDVYRLHQDELDAIVDDEQRARRLTEFNVLEQCINLYKTGIIQKRRLETFKDPDIEFTHPRIHGFVFDPRDGILHKLKLDFRGLVEKYSGVYDLYETDAETQAHYMLKRPGGSTTHLDSMGDFGGVGRSSS